MAENSVVAQESPESESIDHEDYDYWNVEQATVIDTSETETRFVLVGDDGVHLTLSRTAYRLLRLVAAGQTFADISRAVSKPTAQVSEQEIRQKYEAVTSQLRAVREGTAQTARSTLPWGFWLPVRLVPEGLVRQLARLCEFFFLPWLR